MTENKRDLFGLPDDYHVRIKRVGIPHAEREVNALTQHIAHVASTWGPWMCGDVPGLKSLMEMRNKLQAAVNEARLVESFSERKEQL